MVMKKDIDKQTGGSFGGGSFEGLAKKAKDNKYLLIVIVVIIAAAVAFT